MRTQHWVRLLVLAGALASVAATLGCQTKEQPTATAQPSPETPVPVSSVPAAPVALLRVEAQKVCMINDRFMGAPQIPVAVEGKTYYGCCPMCERRLKEEPNSRFGVDPVSKKRVDKAGAVIGKLQSGGVLYFESEETFRAYQQRT